MSTLFEKRERAAESLFAHSEETRFLIRRRGIEALAAWAGESMELDEAGRTAYASRLVDGFIAGTHEDQIVATVQTDLERAGKPSLAGHVATVLAQACAEAHHALTVPSAHAAPTSAPDAHQEWERRHPKSKPGWSL